MKLKKKSLFMGIFTIILFLICIACLSQISFAGTGTKDPGQFEDGTSSLSEPIRDLMGTGLGVVQKVAAGVAITILLVLGIKFLLAGPEGKAVSKKAFVYYVIGFTIASMGTTIISMISKIMVE